MDGGALAELLRVLAPPLDYLASDDFQRVGRTGLPLAAWRERLEKARAEAGDTPLLATLARIVAGLDDVAAAPALLREAHGLLPALRAAAGEGAGAGPARSRARTRHLAGGGEDAPLAAAREPGPPPGKGDPGAEGGAGETWDEYRVPTGDAALALAALAAPVERIRAVGPKRAKELERFGLRTLEDVLFHLPFRYEDRRVMTPLVAVRAGMDVTTTGEIQGVRQGVVGRQKRRILEVVLRDGGGTLQLVWFNQVQWFGSRFAAGQRVVVHGRVEPPMGAGPYRIVHPEVTALGGDGEAENLPPVVPVYEKPTAMPVGTMRRIVHEALDAFGARVPAGVPAEVAARRRILDPMRALRHVHQPPAEANLAALGEATSLAHRSLIFDELFFLQLGLALRRSEAGQEPGTAFAPGAGTLGSALRARLPFPLTGAQERAVTEIAADLALPHPMRRLLQGDVGSGKTLVALLAALVVIDAGWQAALMAPTELLAEQHCETVRPLLAPLGIEPVLLTGSVKGRARRDALAALQSGAAFAVGTHALIQEGVAFAKLGLAIVDEQHRFGVMQRAALQRQGPDRPAVDVLVMSATPIPRTLAMTLYGDLAVSTLDELPPGRTPIATRLVREGRRRELYDAIRAEVAAGHQAYVVYPLVEDSEKSDLRAATTMVHELAAGPLAGLRLDLVHGRMKPDEKDAVMRRFKARDFDVLVATTVIEVGIDVPNATVIAIEHAERFGLAQLHQLRGRVGRGRAAGHCFLVVPDWMAPESYQRMAVLEGSTDGFAIAEADLQLRGPGDFLGTRQAGLPPFRVANLLRDTELLRAARDEALRWLAYDPALTRPQSATLRAVLRHRWQGRLELARVG
ncbi:MAG: ATP-dependent DNA helicase RecG [bacterium]|nr:ATP-dependent DNA helicase RecG [bacterium]